MKLITIFQQTKEGLILTQVTRQQAKSIAEKDAVVRAPNGTCKLYIKQAIRSY